MCARHRSKVVYILFVYPVNELNVAKINSANQNIMDIFGEVFVVVTSPCSSLPAFLTCTQAFNSRNRDQPNSTEILELSGTIEYETSVKSVRGFRRHSSL